MFNPFQCSHRATICIFIHDAGITKALVEELPVEIKTKHNFDMAKATAFREQSTKEQAEMANKSMERKQASEDARVAEALRKKEEMDKTPRLTVSQSCRFLIVSYRCFKAFRCSCLIRFRA